MARHPHNHKIRVEISGVTGSGKTQVAALLNQVLESHGIFVQMNPSLYAEAMEQAKKSYPVDARPIAVEIVERNVSVVSKNAADYELNNDGLKQVIRSK